MHARTQQNSCVSPIMGCLEWNYLKLEIGYHHHHHHYMVAPLSGGKSSSGAIVRTTKYNLKLPRTFTEYTEWCFHLPDTCFERSTPRSRRKLKDSIFNSYTCFDVICPHHYTCHSYLYISDNKERNANTWLPF